VKVLLACPYAWDAPGGVQVHVRELAVGLRSLGHETRVLAPGRSDAAEDGVELVGRPIEVPYNRSTAPIAPWPTVAGRVRRALEAFGPDVVHAHEPLTPSASMFAVRAAAAAGVPVVATFHSGAERAWLFDLAAPVLRRVARAISVRVAVSEAAAAFARKRLGGSFDVVPNGVHVERFAGAEPRRDLPDGRRLLFVGRLHPRKGFAVAVEAFGHLAGRFDDVILVAAGEGTQRTAVDRLTPGARRRVVMLGSVPNVDLPPIHAACDLFVAPSVGGESFGIVVAEAMAAGLPVVASDIPGYREVVRHGVDGLLVPPNDPGALATVCGEVLDDPELAARLRTSARERAQAFSWDRVIERLVRVYEVARSG
jgi:phosphatidylinositol alpha-mannosyltransferase